MTMVIALGACYSGFLAILPISETIRIVVSLPVDLTAPEDEHLARLEERGVKGRYVSVEHIKELGRDRVEWRMATSSTPGGSIPTFIAEASIAGSIAKVGQRLAPDVSSPALRGLPRMFLISSDGYTQNILVRCSSVISPRIDGVSDLLGNFTVIVYATQPMGFFKPTPDTVRLKEFNEMIHVEHHNRTHPPSS
jgi:hypothetical protein